jgi:zinc finger protein
MAPGSLGSHYTTIEGLLDLIITNLTDNNPFGTGDSALNKKYQEFIKKVEKLKEGNTEFSLVLDDALSNCFVYNPFAPEADPQMEITVYERTWDQNEELGINDMNV